MTAFRFDFMRGPEFMGYRIRTSELSDTENLGRVHAQAWQETYPGILPADALAKFGSIEARTTRRRDIFNSTTPLSAHFAVENADRKIVGFGDCGPALEVKEFAPSEVYTFYLLHEAQGKGMGKKLLFKMFSHLADKGFAAVALKTNANGKSNQFYQYCGGQVVGQIPSESWVNNVYAWPNLKNFMVDKN
jgi:L-amino acid N-acyltransferase YncA